MYLSPGVRTESTPGKSPHSPGPNVPWLTLAQIMELVEKRLRWYGFDGWRIRDAICNAGSSVTVLLRGTGRATLAITLGRDGAVHRVSLAQDPPQAPTPKPVEVHHARSLCTGALATRAIAALASVAPLRPALGTV